jgi:hypothetical protein
MNPVFARCENISVVRIRTMPIMIVVALAACSSSSGGALSRSVWPSSVTIGHPTKVGTTVGFSGPMMMINSTDENVTIVKVELQHLNAGLAFEGWVIRDVSKTALKTGVQEPFPPANARDASARIITPSSSRNDAGQLIGDAELIVGITLTAPGAHAASGVRVTFTDGDGVHVMTFRLTAVLCDDVIVGSGTCDLDLAA